MKRSIIQIFTAGSLILFITAHAQQPQLNGSSSPPSSKSAEKPPGAEAPASGVIPELQFEGGTVQQLLDRLRFFGKNSGLPPLNAIVPDGMQEQTVPRLELHNVSYDDVFQALNKMNRAHAGVWELSGRPDSSRQIWVLNSPPDPVQFPQIDPLTGQPLNAGPPPRTCQIYQLQRFLSKYEVEDITTAIKTAWSMVDLQKGTELKYHKDTSLLIAVGRPDQLEIITRVLHSLDEGLAQSGPAAKRPSGEVYVNGAVHKPGSFTLSVGEDLDILEAIARAGGLTKLANESKIKFMRRGSPEKIFRLSELKDTSKDRVILKPGDIIEVEEKLF
jgi:hypothetical protein